MTLAASDIKALELRGWRSDKGRGPGRTGPVGGCFLPEPAEAAAASRANTGSPQEFTVGDSELHIWWMRLDLESAEVERLADSLSAQERLRSRRYFFARDGNRFVATRGLLRTVLARYADIDAAAVQFSYGQHGKPLLQTKPELRFNLAHADGLALLALAREREVGVDLERVRFDVAVDDIAEHFFAPGEIAALRELPPGQRVDGFFTCWTRKEAYVKARGGGLSIPLDSFTVFRRLEAPPRLEEASASSAATARWILRDLTPPAGFKAAVVIEAGGLSLREWTL